MAMPRRTVGRTATFSGVGLFSGATVSCRILAAEAGAGLVFARADVDGAPRARAHVSRLVREDAGGLGMRNTTIEVGPGTRISTIEHVLSACAGLGVTDAIIEVEGPEAPIGDGSSAFVVEAILAAGLEPLERAIEPITIEETMRVEGEDGSYVEVGPGAGFTYELEYPAHADRIPAQSASWSGDADEYAKEIAPARTFCLREEAEAMRSSGLFEHLSARDLLVFGEHGPIDNALRFDDEPARHKLLDLIGDLALAGAPIAGRVHARRAGHALNHAMARRIASLRS